MAASKWSSTIEKTCIKCNKYGDHLEKIKILSHPKVLRLVLLRFGNSLQKIDKQIQIDPELNIFGIQYQLTGIINHHGNSIRNGHYTATVRYNSWWHVNDNNVNPAPSNCFQNNSTAYLAFYRQ